MDYAGYALCSGEAFKLVQPCEPPWPIKPDFAVCAVDPIKLVIHFLVKEFMIVWPYEVIH